MIDNKICRDDGRCEYAIQTGAEAEGHCPSGKCVMPKPAAHLTIPGALEWDGDNGTHGADGELRADRESGLEAQPVPFIVGNYYRTQAGALVRFVWVHSEGTSYETMEDESGVNRYTRRDFGRVTGSPHDFSHPGNVQPLYIRTDSEEVESLRAQLASTEQSRRSFFDLSQDLEKRLAYMVEAMNQIVQVSSMYEKPFEIATLAIGELSAMVTAPASLAEIDPFAATEAPYVPLSAAKVEAFMSMFDSDRGKPKTCIECDQPYCHGVCVERGDQDYDRDQAARGGCDE